jgi:hypothetical protein
MMGRESGLVIRRGRNSRVVIEDWTYNSMKTPLKDLLISLDLGYKDVLHLHESTFLNMAS